MKTSVLSGLMAAVTAATLAPLAACPAVALAQENAPASAAPQQKLDLSAGRLRLVIEKGARLRLFVDGVPLITESHLYLVKPGWTAVLLNTDELRPTITQTTENGAQVATAVFENADAYARYRFEMRPDNTLSVRVAYGTKNGASAQVEYAASYMNANPLYGRPFAAETVDGPRSGSIPSVATSESQEESRVTPFFRKMQIDSRLGPLTITVEGNNEATAALNLFDARGGTQEWANRHPIFWLGLGSPPRTVAAGENVVTITYALGAAPRQTPAPVVEAKQAAVTPLEAARVPFARERPIIPRPKEMTPGTVPLRLSRSARIVLPSAPTPEEKAAGEEIRAELKEFWGLSLPVVTTAEARPGDIRLGRASLLPQGAVTPTNHPEGYALSVDSRGVTVAGQDARGVYHGAHTLKQLIRMDEQGVFIQPVTVRDWPTLAWRGVHWFGGPRSWPFHQQMIDRIAAPLKYNAMVYEIDYTQWASQPKIWSPTMSTPRADVKRSVDYARAHFLEPIPLVNALGHMEWLFVNKQNLDIAADPSHPYAIDPENPRTYEVLLPILDEAIDLFQPQTLHIGHDEVSLFGTFPKKGSTRTESELFIQNVNLLHAHLAKRGVRTMMWGDMMLHSSEGSGGAAYATSPAQSAERRNGIPKNILIADWHYGGPDYPSTTVFRREGFESVAGTWYDPTNIRGFAQTAAKDGASGLLQTTWAGYTMSPEIVKGESFPQFVAYLTAAEHAWNGGASDAATLGYSPAEEFLALWERKPVDRARHKGFTVDLATAANTALWAWSPEGVAPSTAAPSPDFPSGLALLGGVRFQSAGRGIWLSGALNPKGAWPRAVRLPLGGCKAAALEWLLGTTFATPTGTTIARVSIAYADGQTVEVPLVYGKETFAFTDARGSSEVTTVWTGRTPANETARVRRWTWKNPRPGAPLASVTLASENTEAAPVLLGLTGIE